MTEPTKITKRRINARDQHDVLCCETCQSEIGPVGEVTPHTLRDCVMNLVVQVKEREREIEHLYDLTHNMT